MSRRFQEWLIEKGTIQDDEQKVREFYLKEMLELDPDAKNFTPWDELEEWMRASWRLEFRDDYK